MEMKTGMCAKCGREALGEPGCCFVYTQVSQRSEYQGTTTITTTTYKYYDSGRYHFCDECAREERSGRKQIFGSLGIYGNAPRCCGLGAWLKLWQAEVEQNFLLKGFDLCRQ